MKEKFSAFYIYSTEEELKEIWKDEKTLFVFDTNILLSIYSLNTQTRDTFFSILDSLEGRVWLPFHVGLEYQRNRIGVIGNSSGILENFRNRVEELASALTHDENKLLAIKNNYQSLFQQHKSIEDSYENFINEYKSILQKNKDKLTKNIENFFESINKDKMEYVEIDGFDKIRFKLDQIFSQDRIGDCLFQNNEELEKFYKEAEERFENKIPPGFEDSKKDSKPFFYGGLQYFRKYGDLIIFKELINKAKNNQGNIKNLIFITDDSKQDWIQPHEIDNKKIKLGVHYSLKEEIIRESNISDFKIFDQESFLKITQETIYKNHENSVDDLISDVKLININRDKKFKDFINNISMNNIVKNKYSSFYIKNDLNKPTSELKRIIKTLSKQIYINEDFENVAQKLITYCEEHSFFLDNDVVSCVNNLKKSLDIYKDELQFKQYLIDKKDIIFKNPNNKNQAKAYEETFRENGINIICTKNSILSEFNNTLQAINNVFDIEFSEEDDDN